MKKRVFAVFLAAALCVGFMPAIIYAEGEQPAVEEEIETEPENEDRDNISVLSAEETDESSESCLLFLKGL